ncbi:MAG: TIGR03943 family protein [Oscillospiraceae bacterium]|jgi:putative membrane protein|nr:TIGR03943 family protein [Oscillospiraceae bacterium]
MAASSKPGAFSPQTFLETLIYAGFGCVLIYLVASGEYLRYLTPKMKPYLCFAAIVMLVWTCSGALRLGKTRGRARCAHCFALAVPILLILLPHRAMDASDVSFGYISAAPNVSPQTIAEPADSAAPTPAPSPAAPGLSGLDEANRSITVNDTEYYLWIMEIYDNLDKYEGYEFSVTGFVFKDPSLMSDGEFVPARLMMSCCVADLVSCGIICRYDGAGELENDSWVTVKGVIERGEYMGYEEARIVVSSVSPAAPIEDYVYSYAY